MRWLQTSCFFDMLAERCAQVRRQIDSCLDVVVAVHIVVEQEALACILASIRRAVGVFLSFDARAGVRPRARARTQK